MTLDTGEGGEHGEHSKLIHRDSTGEGSRNDGQMYRKRDGGH